MSLPKDYRVRLTKGDTYVLTVLYKEENGDPVNLTGKTIVWNIWLADESQLELTSGSGLTTTPSSGLIVISLTAPQTTALLVGTDYRHTLRNSTDDTTIMTGYLDAFDPINP